MGSMAGRLGVRRFLGAIARPEEGQGCLKRGWGVRFCLRLPLSGPAGRPPRRTPWEGYAAWTAGASCTGASSVAIRTRL